MRFFYYIIIVYLTSVSCVNKSCEEFNFSKLPYDSSYFTRELFYSNGIDTLKFEIVNKESSIKMVNPPYYYPLDACNPTFYVSLKSNRFNMNIEYEFDYYAYRDTNLVLDLFVNYSKIKVNLNELDFNYTKLFNLSDKNTHFLNLPKEDYIRKISLDKMRVKMFEKYSGEKWYLLNYNDTLDGTIR